MWMWGRGVLGPFLVWVVRQQLQDREEPEAGTEAEPGLEPTHPELYSHHVRAELCGTPCDTKQGTLSF